MSAAPASAKPFPPSTGSSTPTFNQTTPTSATAYDGLITLSDITLTGTPTTGYTATATMTVGANPTPIDVQLQYSDSSNWMIMVEEDSANDSGTAVSGTSLDIDDVSGTITSTDGRLEVALTLSGQSIGDSTFTMSVAIDDTGFTASALVEDLNVGGLELTSASVMVSTQSSSASITASLTTEAGTFDASLSVDETAPATRNSARSAGSPRPQDRCSLKDAIEGTCSFQESPTPTPLASEQAAYEIDINVSGAELAGEDPDFKLLSFGFSTTIDTSPTECTEVDVTVSASLKVNANTYTLDDGTLIFCGSDVWEFELVITISHTATSTGKTTSGELTLAWTDIPNSLETAEGETIEYVAGYFGQVVLSETRDFSEKLDGRTFSKSVTISIGFGIAVFQPTTGADFTFDVGAGGSVKADRVSGDLVCIFNDAETDVVCSVKLRLNPSWAGIYHHDWDNL